MQKIIVLFCITALSIAGGCKKETPTPSISLTATQMLTGKKWQVRSSTIVAPGQPNVDLYALSAPCTRDDFERFDSPNTYFYEEGATKCDPGDPQTQLGIWALSNNDTQLTVTYSGFTKSLLIDELTTTSLKTRMLELQSNGTTSVTTTTFSVIN